MLLFRCVLQSKIPLVDERGVPTLTQIGREVSAGATLDVYPFTTPGVVNVSVSNVHTIHPLFARYEDVLRACKRT